MSNSQAARDANDSWSSPANPYTVNNLNQSVNRVTEPLKDDNGENLSTNNQDASMMIKNLAEEAEQGTTEGDEVEQALVETALTEMVNEALRQLKTFLIIIYGCCVRFYSTVVDWEYIQRMNEDLIERMTSKLFEEPSFSALVV